MREEEGMPDRQDPPSGEPTRSHPVMDRLPPPAFPPGYRRDRVHRPRPRDEAATGHTDFPAEAFFSPDDPIRRPAGGRVEADGSETPAGDPESSQRRQPAPRPPRGTHPSPTVDEIADLLEDLAHEVRGLGGARFGWKPGAAPLEAALRGVLSGYLRQGRG